MVQTFKVFVDDPTTAKIKPYAGLCCKNKNCENFFCSLWWHFHTKVCIRENFPLYRIKEAKQ